MASSPRLLPAAAVMFTSASMPAPVATPGAAVELAFGRDCDVVWAPPLDSPSSCSTDLLADLLAPVGAACLYLKRELKLADG
eukprot:12424746-Karenia_brevis.AAC.1